MTDPGNPVTLRRYSLSITVRTPVHVGSGLILREGFDFLVENEASPRMVTVLDVDRALDLLTDREIAVARDGRIANALGANGRAQATRRRLPIVGTGRPGEIREQIRRVDGAPYLPGSSVKGALRTAFLTYVARRMPHPPVADARQIEKLAQVADLPDRPGAQGQNRDLLRAVRIGDLYPDDPATAIELVEVKARHLRPSDRDRGDIPIWCEALRPGTVLRGDVTIESAESPLRLAARRAGESGNALAAAQADALARLFADAVPELARGLADYESTAQATAGLPPSQIWGLIAEQSANRTQAGGGDWLNLGWGGGWHARTLAVVLKERNPPEFARAAESARRRHRSMGPLPDIFPGTRRLAMRERGVAPMGWVRVDLVPR